MRAQVEGEITDLAMEQAHRLGDGGHRFTGRQLYYAVCAALERPALPSATKGIFGTGLILIVIAGIVSRFHPPIPSIILVSLGGLLVLLAPLNARSERRRALVREREPRPLALSWQSFAAGPLERVAGQIADALVAPSAAGGDARSPRAAGAPPQRAPVVACDREEAGALVRANLDRLPGDTTVVTVPGAARAEDLRGRRVVALHDADPAGCALPGLLRAAGAEAVADAGLHPPASDGGLQVIEGAPARVPEGLEADLSPEQVGWLRSGRRLELATLTPKEVMERISEALQRLGPARERAEGSPAVAPPGAAMPGAATP